MPPLTMQEEGLIKGTSCHSRCPTSGASRAAPAGASEGRVAATPSRCPGWQGVLTCVCEWGHMPPAAGGRSGGLPSLVGYLSPQRLLLPQVSGTTASTLSVARVAGPRCLAGDPLLGCVPARLSTVVAMAPGDVCNVPDAA